MYFDDKRHMKPSKSTSVCRVCSYALLLVMFLFFAGEIQRAETQETSVDSNKADTRNGLQITIELLDPDPEDELSVAVSLTNVSTTSLTLYRHTETQLITEFSWFIYDAEGRFQGNPDPICQTLYPPLKPTDFVTLKPGEGLKVQFPLSDFGYSISQPGNYLLEVSYRSPIIRKNVPGDARFWSLENGVIKSSRIPFRVSRRDLFGQK